MSPLCLPGIVLLVESEGAVCDLQSDDDRCDDCQTCDDSDDSDSER